MLIGTLGTSLLGNLLIAERTITAGEVTVARAKSFNSALSFN